MNQQILKIAHQLPFPLCERRLTAAKGLILLDWLILLAQKHPIPRRSDDLFPHPFVDN